MQSLHRVEKSPPLMARAALRWEISRLRVSSKHFPSAPYRHAAPLEMTVATSSIGHTFGVRVDGTSSRRFLRFVSLTAFQAEGCGGGIAANFIMPPSAVTSISSVIIILTTVHPFATSWPSSPKGDARNVTGLAVCVICDTISSATYFLVSP